MPNTVSAPTASSERMSDCAPVMVSVVWGPGAWAAGWSPRRGVAACSVICLSLLGFCSGGCGPGGERSRPVSGSASIVRISGGRGQLWCDGPPAFVQQKTPRAKGMRGGGASGWFSADAPAKYENSGGHGIDLPPARWRVSSRWDRRLTMRATARTAHGVPLRQVEAGVRRARADGGGLGQTTRSRVRGARRTAARAALRLARHRVAAAQQGAAQPQFVQRPVEGQTLAAPAAELLEGGERQPDEGAERAGAGPEPGERGGDAEAAQRGEPAAEFVGQRVRAGPG